MGHKAIPYVATFCICLISFSTFAKLVPVKDPANGVLDADLVVIVQYSAIGPPGTFVIREVLLGNAKQGDSICLGDFKLSVLQEEGPTVVVPITPETRILVFLQRQKCAPGLWQPTYFKSSYFWVQRPEDTPLLKRAGERVVHLRKQWEAARDLPDPKQRVAALWPFLSLSSYGVSFVEHTKAEMTKLKPVSGEYFAQQFDAMSHDERMLLLPDAGAYGSQQLHARLIADLKLNMHYYEAFAEKSSALPKTLDWSTMPERVKDALGEIYYGTSGLVKFHDRTDLPFIREVAVWSAKYHEEQVAEAAIDGFREMPDKANLPVLEVVLREFLPKGEGDIQVQVERALCQHRYPDTVPLLAPFLRDDFLASETEPCLSHIVGHDLGTNPKAWTDWYANNH